jgi:hypothetical protein
VTGAAKRPGWIVPVGGFLGAGKTTLIRTAAALVAARGLRVGAVVNDQGGELVDQAWLREEGLETSGVDGACFCCRYDNLLRSIAAVREARCEVIFLEPVGSCTDLAATVIRPLLDDLAGTSLLAPLTVLADPALARAVLRGEAPREVEFLFRHQMEEADLVCFTRADTDIEAVEWPGVTARRLSAVTGAGVEAWLNEVMAGTLGAGTRHLAIDYALYAEAEAALGWLNWRSRVTLDEPLAPAMLLGPFLDPLIEELRRTGAGVAHLKAFDRTPAGWLKVALTSSMAEPQTEGDLLGEAAIEHDITLNVRALVPPDRLCAALEAALRHLAGRRSETSLQCFQPAPPRPSKRTVP